MNAGINVSILLLMLAAISFFLGISFFLYSKNVTKGRYSVAAYCIFAGLWCLNYGSIGFMEHLEWVWFVRLLGIISIDAFLFMDYLLVSLFANKTGFSVRKCLFGLLAVVDLLVFGRAGVNKYVRIGGWTTWYTKDMVAHNIHSAIVFVFFAMLFVEGFVWLKNNQYIRQRRFISFMFLANFIMVFCSIPDTFTVLVGQYAIPTSGIGAGICSIVVWEGARRLNAFNIEVGNVSSNIYDFINVGILVYDMEEKPMLANPFARKLLGITEKKPPRFEDLFDTEDGEKATLAQAEYSRIRAKNTGISCKTIDTLANDQYGQPFCHIVAVYDMTSEDQIQEELKKAMDAKMDFLAAMSHEIRTPINSVLGYNELIGRESNQSQVQEYSGYIQSAGISLLGLINDVLDMAKIESKQMELHPVEYDLEPMIVECCNLFTIKAKDKGLTFTLENNERIPRRLLGDEIRVRQAITNVIDNAIKYTPSGGVTVSVNFAREEEKRVQLVIQVKDTGIGIAEDQLPYIFDSFKRIEATKNRHIEGSGLGLTITKNLVESMGGSVMTKSTPGKGTEFTLVIPQVVVEESACGTMNLYMTGKTGKYVPSFTNSNFHILVVDDNEMNSRLFCKLLEPTGLPVDVAADGNQALELIFKQHYDLIFMDHMMPEMDGVETYKRMKMSSSHPNQNTPVIMLTANALNGAKATYLEEGFADYLAKPFSGAELEKMICKYLPGLSLPQDTQVDSLFQAMCRLPEVQGEVLLQNLPDEELRQEVFTAFIQEKKGMLDALLDAKKEVDQGKEEGFASYRIQVHSMKNSLKLLGAMEMAQRAQQLENAAKEQDGETIAKGHEAFTMDYLAFAGEVQSLLQENRKQEGRKQDTTQKDVQGSLLEELKEAMENFDADKAYELAEKLRQTSTGEGNPNMEKLLEAVRDLDLPAFTELYENL